MRNNWTKKTFEEHKETLDAKAFYCIMYSTPSTANVLNNISTETRFRNCCCDMDRLSVINTGAVPVTLAPNSAFVIERRS